MHMAITAHCRNCGKVDLLPGQITLISESDQLAYWFDCPDWHETVVRPADEVVGLLLLYAGVDTERKRASARSAHPAGSGRRPHPVDPPLTHDDLLDFHELLQRDDWFAQLERC
jgi:hypothetical protein